jgi:hypothetical protein
MMSNHIDARLWALPTLQNDLNLVTVSITDYYPDRLLAMSKSSVQRHLMSQFRRRKYPDWPLVPSDKSKQAEILICFYIDVNFVKP